MAMFLHFAWEHVAEINILNLAFCVAHWQPCLNLRNLEFIKSGSTSFPVPSASPRRKCVKGKGQRKDKERGILTSLFLL